MLHFLSAKIIYNKVRLGQKVLKFKFLVEAVIIFIKNMEKASSGIQFIQKLVMLFAINLP